MAAKLSVVRYRTTERRVIDKYVDAAGNTYECDREEGLDNNIGPATLIGWRVERDVITYEMPVEDFIAHATKVVV